ncbi:MAG: PEP-CTERM sorting domain-containing protein [Rubrivivax sp.]
MTHAPSPLLRHTLAAALLPLAALCAAPAQATPSQCGAGTLTATFADLSTTSYQDCTGAWDGNLSPGTAAAVGAIIQLEFGLSGAAYLGSTGNADNPWTNNPGSVAAGMLNFAHPFSALFVVGLHSGDQNAPVYPGHAVAQGGDFSLYLFDGTTHGGITSIAFDTLGVSTTQNGGGRNLSHAALYAAPLRATDLPPPPPPPADVPEPATWALAGLAAVAAARRRRA